jgi:hypothetical protein
MSLRRRGRLRRTAGVAGADSRQGRAVAARLHRQAAAVRPTAFAPTLLCAAAGGPPLSGVRLCPQGRHHPSPVAALQRPIQGSRLRPESFPAAGWRAGGDRVHRPPQAAPGGRPRPASAAAFLRPAESWLIFSSHPQPQGLVFARGPVAEQRASYFFGKSPKLCGWKIYVICHTSYFASPVLMLLLNTSRSLLLLRTICLVSTIHI